MCSQRKNKTLPRTQHEWNQPSMQGVKGEWRQYKNTLPCGDPTLQIRDDDTHFYQPSLSQQKNFWRIARGSRSDSWQNEGGTWQSRSGASIYDVRIAGGRRVKKCSKFAEKHYKFRGLRGGRGSNNPKVLQTSYMAAPSVGRGERERARNCVASSDPNLAFFLPVAKVVGYWIEVYLLVRCSGVTAERLSHNFSCSRIMYRLDVGRLCLTVQFESLAQKAETTIILTPTHQWGSNPGHSFGDLCLNQLCHQPSTLLIT